VQLPSQKTYTRPNNSDLFTHSCFNIWNLNLRDTCTENAKCISFVFRTIFFSDTFYCR
jgi:hypothetical protein